MAFINCLECGHSTTSKRKNCPKCKKSLQPAVFPADEEKPINLALIGCLDCGHEISKTAFRCPQCGATSPATRSSARIFLFIYGLFAIPVLFFVGVVVSKIFSFIYS